MDSDFTIGKYLEEYPIYRRLTNDKLFTELFAEMGKPENLLAMIEACERNRPALEGVLSLLNNERFDNLFQEARPDRDYVKKGVGSAAYFFIKPFGYKKTDQKSLSKSKYFRSAMCFILDKKEKPKYKLVKTVALEPVD